MSEQGCGCGGGSKRPVAACATLSGDQSTPRQAEVRPESVPQLGTRLGWRDRIGGWGVRWGINRMGYTVEPGLYRIGRPDRRSPVLVTANYKLTVDRLRVELGGRDLWLLVLDTRGVNVWCAAAKGTFGTGELVARIASTGLAGLVDHRRAIVPQLGAVGVAAHEVKRLSGFEVRYGPILAEDLPAYLDDRLRATPAMRRVKFAWTDRLVLAPVELVGAAKPALGIFLAVAVLDLVSHGRPTWGALTGFAPYLAAILAGGLVAPLALPWLPFRSFALKGAALGGVLAVAWLGLFPAGLLGGAGLALVMIAIVSFMTLTFTGSTTFTTLAGVKLETRYALPALVSAAVVGVVCSVVAIWI